MVDLLPIPELLRKVEACCVERGISESTLGRLAVNDGKLVPRLRAGKSITLPTYSRLMEFIVAQPSEAAE